MMSRIYLSGCIALLSMLTLVGSAWAQDAATARKAWQRCKSLLEGGQACEALAACDEGLAAAQSTALQKLRVTAEKRCNAGPVSKKIRDKDKDGIPDKDDRCPEDPEDIDGHEDDDGCTDPDNDNDNVLDEKDRCPFDREDMDGFEDDDGCVDKDNDNDGMEDLVDRCPNDTEDLDGFQDEDGCPELDNDNDSVPDLDDACPNAPEDEDGFNDEDGCPEADNDNDGLNDNDDQCPIAAEDQDGFEDDDGCPEADNDLDGIDDLNDECPLVAEDIDEWRDSDGCPDDDDPTPLSLFGWIATGVGVAAGGASLALHLVAESERDRVLNPSASNLDMDHVTSPRQIDIPSIEDDANTLDTAAAVLVGVAGAAIATGVILIVMDYTGEKDTGEESSELILSPMVGAQVGGVAAILSF